VGHDDDGGPIGVDPVDEIADLLSGCFVELTGRLVREQQPRAIGQRSSNGHPLHFTA
jgi:hypothetical protein